MAEISSETPESESPPDDPQPIDLEEWMGRWQGPMGVLVVSIAGLFLLAIFYTLTVGKVFFIPIVVALLLHRLLRPVVDGLARWHIPRTLGTGLLLLGLLAVTLTGIYRLSGPAAEWLDETPKHLRSVEYKLRGFKAQLQELQQAAEKVEQAANVNGGSEPRPVQVEQTGLSDVLLSQTWTFLAGAAVTFILLYFLLASGDFFIRTLVRVLPSMYEKRTAVKIMRRTDRDLTTYLTTVTMINAGLGAIIAAVMYLLGLPNPVLWGVMAAFLNFVPYVGAVVGIGVVGIVSIVTFDTLSYALLAPALYFLINATEGSFITPAIMGQRLTIHPLMVFLALIFWGWIWGIPGALLAVPLLTAFKVVCDNIEMLTPIGAFLDR